VIDGYTTLPWETLCQQVICIKIGRREGKLLSLPMAAGASSASHPATVTGPLRAMPAQFCAQVIAGFGNYEGIRVGRTGFGPVTSTV
jgi:hypothetical protein